MKNLKTFEQLHESNEQRGYVDYEYDIKTGALKRTGSGVTSELSIWGWWGDEGPVFPFEQIKDKAEIKKIIDSGKIKMYKLGTDYSDSDIKRACAEWVKKNK